MLSRVCVVCVCTCVAGWRAFGAPVLRPWREASGAEPPPGRDRLLRPRATIAEQPVADLGQPGAVARREHHRRDLQPGE
eukprot:SAG22_NODE_2905_length_2114_cov_1.388586_3_plen_78_part_01